MSVFDVRDCDKEILSSIQFSSNKNGCSNPDTLFTSICKDTLQEYIQSITDMVIHATGTYPTAVTCQLTIVIFLRHSFNDRIKKKVAEARIIQTLGM